MPRAKARLAAVACCLSLIGGAALAQSAPNTPISPSATPAPAAVPDTAPPAQRPREAGSVIPIPHWRDGSGQLLSIEGNKLSDPERMNAGVPHTPLPPGSIVQNVPGMNAMVPPRPLPVGSTPNTQDEMRAGPAPTTMPVGVEGLRAGESAYMQAGPSARPLPVGRTPSDIVEGGLAPTAPAEGGGGVPRANQGR